MAPSHGRGFGADIDPERDEEVGDVGLHGTRVQEERLTIPFVRYPGTTRHNRLSSREVSPVGQRGASLSGRALREGLPDHVTGSGHRLLGSLDVASGPHPLEPIVPERVPQTPNE